MHAGPGRSLKLVALGLLACGVAAWARPAPRDPLAEARQLKRQGRGAAAVNVLRGYLKDHESSVEAHHVLGWTLVDLGQREAAGKELARVSELAPTSYEGTLAKEALDKLGKQPAAAAVRPAPVHVEAVTPGDTKAPAAAPGGPAPGGPAATKAPAPAGTKAAAPGDKAGPGKAAAGKAAPGKAAAPSPVALDAKAAPDKGGPGKSPAIPAGAPPVPGAPGDLPPTLKAAADKMANDPGFKAAKEAMDKDPNVKAAREAFEKSPDMENAKKMGEAFGKSLAKAGPMPGPRRHHRGGPFKLLLVIGLGVVAALVVFVALSGGKKKTQAPPPDSDFEFEVAE